MTVFTNSFKNQPMDKEKADEAARKEWEKESTRNWERRPSPAPKRTSYSRNSRQVAYPVVKVLTSATFIRGILGILKKVM
jgi:uncharacterized protein